MCTIGTSAANFSFPFFNRSISSSFFAFLAAASAHISFVFRFFWARSSVDKIALAGSPLVFTLSLGLRFLAPRPVGCLETMVTSAAGSSDEEIVVCNTSIAAWLVA